MFKKTKNDAARDYKYTFATGNEDGFIYFVFNHSSTIDVCDRNIYVYTFIHYVFKFTYEQASKAMVARICKSDPFYKSYVEIPIKCGPGLTNHLLSANYIPDNSNVNSDGTLYLLFSKSMYDSMSFLW